MDIPLSYEYERDDYYCYPGSTILKNRLDIKDEQMLIEKERRYTTLRSAELAAHPLKGELNADYLRNIHRFLFGEIYDWAGENRKIDISRGNIFCMHELIDVCLDQAMKELKEENFLSSLDKNDTISRLAYYIGEINTIHPFREGNGRAQRAFIRELAARNGYRLVFDNVTPKEMVVASNDTFHHEYDKMEEVIRKSLVA